MNAKTTLLLMLLAVFSLSARGQFVMTITGAPFSATWTTTTDKAGSVTTTRIVASRSSDGSVYRAIYKDGQLDWIEIEDVPHERHVEIRPQLKQYTETEPPGGRWVTRTMEQHHAILERWNIQFTRQATTQRKDSTPLGMKVVDGMTLYGHHYVRTRDRDNVRTVEGEAWESDFGVTYSERTETFSVKTIETTTLTEMKRGEPDASLFIVPSGYTQTGRGTR
jgi:hypothetical protein